MTGNGFVPIGFVASLGSFQHLWFTLGVDRLPQRAGARLWKQRAISDLLKVEDMPQQQLVMFSRFGVPAFLTSPVSGPIAPDATPVACTHLTVSTAAPVKPQARLQVWTDVGVALMGQAELEEVYADVLGVTMLVADDGSAGPDSPRNFTLEFTIKPPTASALPQRLERLTQIITGLLPAAPGWTYATSTAGSPSALLSPNASHARFSPAVPVLSSLESPRPSLCVPTTVASKSITPTTDIVGVQVVLSGETSPNSPSTPRTDAQVALGVPETRSAEGAAATAPVAASAAADDVDAEAAAKAAPAPASQAQPAAAPKAAKQSKAPQASNPPKIVVAPPTAAVEAAEAKPVLTVAQAKVRTLLPNGDATDELKEELRSLAARLDAALAAADANRRALEQHFTYAKASKGEEGLHRALEAACGSSCFNNHKKEALQRLRNVEAQGGSSEGGVAKWSVVPQHADKIRTAIRFAGGPVAQVQSLRSQPQPLITAAVRFDSLFPEAEAIMHSYLAGRRFSDDARAIAAEGSKGKTVLSVADFCAHYSVLVEAVADTSAVLKTALEHFVATLPPPPLTPPSPPKQSSAQPPSEALNSGGAKRASSVTTAAPQAAPADAVAAPAASAATPPQPPTPAAAEVVASQPAPAAEEVPPPVTAPKGGKKQGNSRASAVDAFAPPPAKAVAATAPIVLKGARSAQDMLAEAAAAPAASTVTTEAAAAAPTAGKSRSRSPQINPTRKASNSREAPPPAPPRANSGGRTTTPPRSDEDKKGTYVVLALVTIAIIVSSLSVAYIINQEDDL